jgi:hypothetical protein
MKTLTSPKSTFLLDAPLEVLHSESLEWLEEVEFWKDESAFFYALLIGQTKEHSPIIETKNSKDIERHLIYVSAEKLDDFKMEVERHEKFLVGLLGSSRMDEQLYRIKHHNISEKIQNFEKEFKEMKSKVFKLVAKKHK